MAKNPTPTVTRVSREVHLDLDDGPRVTATALGYPAERTFAVTGVALIYYPGGIVAALVCVDGEPGRFNHREYLAPASVDLPDDPYPAWLLRLARQHRPRT